ncbi:MAG: deoxyribodipyrimidine photo-lyase [Phycisphaerales bacterium]|nr:deoxyribodipyrimidine photo-lyase [Phycisphaerales bacterium]
MKSLVWFRSDLRTDDNPALREACSVSDDGVIAVFVVCPEQWKRHDWADIRVAFLLRNLRALSDALSGLNIPLLIRECRDFGGVPDVLERVIREHAIDCLCFNREYEVNETGRDDSVASRCREIGCRVRVSDDQCILTPGAVKTQQDGWYTVFTPFKKQWLGVYREDGVKSVAPPRKQADPGVARDDVPHSVLGFDAALDRADLWPAGEDAARKRLEQFVESKIARYDELRDRPDINGTSTLSPYLAHGVISARVCLEFAIEAHGGLPDPKSKEKSGASVWISELIWREFYRHLLVAFPRLCKHQPFQLETRRIRWRDSDEDFAAWCEGRTGIPIVDAAMRQLARTGWMHNRLRMIAAMFLTKNLLIDWRRGERHFMRHLVDGDLASNNGGWQWSASTGTDAAPYFRIFNPVSQGKRFDPEGRFVRALVPELGGIEGDAVHEPWAIPSLLCGELRYPDPICDLGETRQRAIDAFKALK